MSTRYFFDQDDSCHWYLVPLDKRKEWLDWRDGDPEDPASWDAPEWAERIDGGAEAYSFTDPRPL